MFYGEFPPRRVPTEARGRSVGRRGGCSAQNSQAVTTHLEAGVGCPEERTVCQSLVQSPELSGVCAANNTLILAWQKGQLSLTEPEF